MFLALACVALVARMPRLGERPMHTDEAVNAYITGEVLSGDVYRYDPEDRHGPMLVAVAVPLAKVAGADQFKDLSESILRLGPVLAGALTILLFAAIAKHVGTGAAFAGATFMAVGALPFYYSRYFIHETYFVAATLGFLICGWRVLATGSRVQGILAGTCAGLMLACKETAVLHFAASLPAVLWFVAADVRRRSLSPSPIRREEGVEHPTTNIQQPTSNPEVSLTRPADTLSHPMGEGGEREEGVEHPTTNIEQPTSSPEVSLTRPADTLSHPMGEGRERAVALAVLAFVIVTVISYTSFGQHWRGPLDLVRSFVGFTDRAGGQGHEKPFWYYARLLTNGWSGWLVMGLALLGMIARFRCRIVQCLSIYCVALFLIYSLIPYKTPWLALNLWLPVALLAGCGISVLWNRRWRGEDAALSRSRLRDHPLPSDGRGKGEGAFGQRASGNSVAIRGFAAALFLVAIALCARDAWQTSFVRPADETNPYAYAHTSPDLVRLPDRLEELASEGMGAQMRVAVVAEDPWPLPWYLRNFPNTGFWPPSEDPGLADVYITSTEAAGALGARVAERRPEFFELRPGVLVILWSPLEPGNGD